MGYELKKVLLYLEEFKDRREIEKKFELNNMQSWKLTKWLTKANLVEVLKGKVEGKKCKFTFFYRVLK